MRKKEKKIEQWIEKYFCSRCMYILETVIIIIWWHRRNFMSILVTCTLVDNVYNNKNNNDAWNLECTPSCNVRKRIKVTSNVVGLTANWLAWDAMWMLLERQA